MTAFEAAGVVVFAWCIDHACGEPSARFHPVVWMGGYLRRAGHRLPALAPRWALVGGALAWSVGAALVVAIACLIEVGLTHVLAPLADAARVTLTILLLGLVLKPMFAWRMLRDEVLAVERALDIDLAAASQRLSRLVSRDVHALGETDIREAAIETLAENLNDSVIAPLWWFAIAGLPGAALYRFANTADAMWGYRGRWEWAGKWAARADDVLSWIPARLTAGALLVLSPRHWPACAREAKRTPSPNGGWPMSAVALALGIRLTKPGVYALNANARSPRQGDVAAAVRLARRAAGIAVVMLTILAAARASL
ncbi:MAG TPA: adenosylcobinamide-phosphate synthase CbiB [Burkholderiaceae bacterium]|nr:adenosylcobinamide-phosphate synthase CbiB [Burkholderiaceae bacterium]